MNSAAIINNPIPPSILEPTFFRTALKAFLTAFPPVNAVNVPTSAIPAAIPVASRKQFTASGASPFANKFLASGLSVNVWLNPADALALGTEI